MRDLDARAALDDTALAAELASGTGRVLLELRSRADRGELPDSTDLRAAGDAAAQDYLASSLAALRPDDAVLSEEATDDRRRLDADRVWIVDPLDGTREFAERNADGSWREDFAVHVALWQRGAGLVAAAVALPARGTVHATGSAPAAATTAARPSRPIRVAVSRTRPPEVATELAQRGLVELAPMGSAGFKTLAVVDGAVDAYVHGGGQYEWDSAAPVAVALAAGMVATRLDGGPLAFNQPSPWCPDLLVCRPSVHATLRAALDAALSASAQVAGQPA